MTNAALVHVSLVSAGATLGTGLLAAAVHLGNRRDDYYVPYAVTALAGTVVFVALAGLYGATTFEAARGALHWHVAGILLTVAAAAWLFARFAQRRMGRVEIAVLLAGTVALLAANTLSPASLRFDALEPAPAGGDMPYRGRAGWSTALLHLWVLVPAALYVVNARHLWRRGERLLGGVAAASAAGFVGADAVGAHADAVGGQPPYLGGPVVAFFVIVLLGLALGLVQRRQRLALVAQDDALRAANAKLREEVVQRARLEQRLAEAHRMEALGRMAAGVAHDFNNVLTVAGGHAELIRRHLAHGSEERRSADFIVDAVERGANLTRQLLAFARRQSLAPTALDPDRAIEAMRDLLVSLLRGQTRLVLGLGGGGRPILADPTQFEQVILNLAINARDAMPDGGELAITTAWRESGAPGACACEGTLDRGHLLLSVSDTGSGIEPDVQPRIFEPFFTTKAPGEGTGLGLSTVHGIVRQSGGCIGVTSRPGEGTTFRVCWPGAPATVPAPGAGTVRPG